jgi:hypothetical protein
VCLRERSFAFEWSAIVDKIDSRAPAQQACFLAGKAEYVEEAVWALQMAEDIADVGPGWEKRVDGCDQGAFVRENALVHLNLSDSPCCQGPNARNVTAGFLAIFS